MNLCGARCRGQRHSRLVWTAVVERDGRHCAHFEVGGRDERAFLRLYSRLREAELCCKDGYWAWLPAGPHLVGEGGNKLE